MSLSREEYQGRVDAALNDHHRQQARKVEAAIYQLRQAEVPITKLTQDPNWNYYLSLLQSKIEESTMSLRAAQEDRTVDFSHAVLAERRAQVLAWQARIDTLEEVLHLPTDILSGAKANVEEG